MYASQVGKSTFVIPTRNVTDKKEKLFIGIADFRQWLRGSVVNPNPGLEPPENDAHHALAQKALLKVRSEDWTSAYKHAEKSIANRPSAMGYIVQALALIGKGELENAMQVFDLTFENCNPEERNLLLLIRAIMLFVSRKYDMAIPRVHDLISVSRDDEAIYCYIQVIGKMYLMQGDYAQAIQSLERGERLFSSCVGSDLEVISLIFGWSFEGLLVTVQRCRCEFFYASGRPEEAAGALFNVLHSLGDEMGASKVAPEWAIALAKKCIDKLEERGDAALGSGEYDVAIGRYTVALSLCPQNSVDINILVKRSKARASKGVWRDALADADEVIKRDPSSHLGYECKYAALHGAEDYSEVNNVLLRMIAIIQNSPNEDIRRLRERYPDVQEISIAIDATYDEISRLCPLVLIDVETGRLCDAQERLRLFKSEVPFDTLVSESAVTTIDRARIRESVAKYFEWVMFSHTWEGKEPTFQDVNLVGSVWDLDGSPLNEKLRQFCKTTRNTGYRWAWSDTCCIDKSTSAILSQSLTSMYIWYAHAAETFVYLGDVLSSAKIDALIKSRWMSRAWTLQELLASKVIRFYDREWKIYLDDGHANHKDSPVIKHELAQAMGVAPETIASFHPDSLGVREKLRLASCRNATVEEDVAYSLIGIFSSDIIPRYGLGKTALGHLLEKLIARTGDVTVIAWTGKSLAYNSALPASLAVYSQKSNTTFLMGLDNLHASVEELRGQVAKQDAITLYKHVAQLRRATFSDRCLHLPCIYFRVTKIGVQEMDGSGGNLYRATVSMVGKVEFRTSDPMPLKKPRRLVFIHPWLNDLRDTLDGFDDEQEAESDTDSDEIESDEGSDGSTDVSEPVSPSRPQTSAQVDAFTQALRMVSRLGCPFHALLLERQENDQYKRVATEQEIVISGIPCQTKLADIRTKVLEIV